MTPTFSTPFTSVTFSSSARSTAWLPRDGQMRSMRSGSGPSAKVRKPYRPVGELQLVRDLMNRVLPRANVTGYEHRVDALVLPDPGDRHVVAAALETDAALIVTTNLRDFPADVLQVGGLRAVDPDAFLVALHAATPGAVVEVTERARRNLRRSVPTKEEFSAALERQGLKQFVAVIRASP